MVCIVPDRKLPEAADCLARFMVVEINYFCPGSTYSAKNSLIFCSFQVILIFKRGPNSRRLPHDAQVRRISWVVGFVG